VKKIVFFTLILLVIIVVLDYTENIAPFFTEYTSGFSYKKLASLKKSLPVKNVREILGEPFLKADNNINCDYYSKPKEVFGLTNFFGWKSIRICYDNNEKLLDIGQNVFFN